MEPSVTVLELCNFKNVSLDLLYLPCLFCHTVLSFQDKCAFLIKNLRVVFRSDSAFGCCCRCLKVVAYHEYCKYYRCSADGCVLDVLTGKCLKDLVVRCLCCMKQLEYVEKLQHIDRGEPYHLIRNTWRATCRLCTSPE
uniref:Protein E6 n=1 Tax=Human papillomavirus TaxID=10566 RepID=A0A385PJB2_9PAPI|nr:MAG: E6 protein [Human papillomavirus]